MAAALFLSSGNLIADRRYDFGRDLQLRGDLSAAADLMTQAVELAPEFASAWFALGDLREQLGERDAAIAAYERARAADTDDRHGAKLRLMRLGAEGLSEMPAGYVRALFDQYAPKFNKTLLNDLDYRGPDILLRAVLEACRAQRRPAHFRCAIDLGCGTGLAGVQFASLIDDLTGIDLSAGMVALAKKTGAYGRLDVADMVEGLSEEADASAHLILSADAMVYLSDLMPLLKGVARVLAPNGLFAFTVETHGGSGVVLGAGLRYAHGEAYLRAVLAAVSLEVCSLERVSTRNEADEPVPGLVVVARR
jgi:predicted TPR repeat methyltransferase